MPDKVLMEIKGPIHPFFGRRWKAGLNGAEVQRLGVFVCCVIAWGRDDCRFHTMRLEVLNISFSLILFLVQLNL